MERQARTGDGIHWFDERIDEWNGPDNPFAIIRGITSFVRHRPSG
jgi:hypothetical protein